MSNMKKWMITLVSSIGAMLINNAYGGAVEDNGEAEEVGQVFGLGNWPCRDYLKQVEEDPNSAALFNIYTHGVFTGAQNVRFIFAEQLQDQSNLVDDKDVVHLRETLTALPALTGAEETALWKEKCSAAPDRAFIAVVMEYYLWAPQVHRESTLE